MVTLCASSSYFIQQIPAVACEMLNFHIKLKKTIMELNQRHS